MLSGGHFLMLKWNIFIMNLCRNCARHVLGTGNKVENKTDKVLFHGAYFPVHKDRTKIRKGIYDIISDVGMSYK